MAIDESGFRGTNPSGGGLAFPSRAVGHVHAPAGYGEDNLRLTLVGGMTLRDYFAGQAMVGLLTNPLRMSYEEYAEDSYYIADAMLKARERE